MHDLLAVVPTRGRPQKARELIAAFRSTGAEAHIVFGVDEDDEALPDYAEIGLAEDVWFKVGPRKSLSAWTNELAIEYAGRYRALMSLGDDHRPRTRGWDAALLAALDATGGTGIAYGDDGIQGQRLPTAAVVSSDIVLALGWLCLPVLRHFYVDDTWKLLAASARCLHYVPDVVIEHLHPVATFEAPDATYRDASKSYPGDRLAFREWRNSDEGAAAIETVRRLVKVPA